MTKTWKLCLLTTKTVFTSDKNFILNHSGDTIKERYKYKNRPFHRRNRRFSMEIIYPLTLIANLSMAMDCIHKVNDKKCQKVDRLLYSF